MLQCVVTNGPLEVNIESFSAKSHTCEEEEENFDLKTLPQRSFSGQSVREVLPTNMRRSQISVLSRGGAGRCAVCGRREATNALSKVKLFQFPAAGEGRRALWLSRCGLRPEVLPARAKICNIHFVSGEPVNSEQDVDFLPSLHLGRSSPTDRLATPGGTSRELPSNEVPLSLGDLAPSVISRDSKCCGTRRTPNNGFRPAKAKRKPASSSQGTSPTASSAARINVGNNGANVFNPNGQYESSQCNEDSENAEDDLLLFDDECPLEECQRRARHLVELLARVGTLERAISDLRHDVRDKEMEIAALLVQVTKSPTKRMQAKVERQQGTIAKLRADLNSLRRSMKSKRRAVKGRRNAARENGRLNDDDCGKTSFVAVTSGPSRKRRTASDRRPRKGGRSEQSSRENCPAAESLSHLPRSPLKLRIRTNMLRYVEDADASSSSIDAGRRDVSDEDFVPPDDDGDDDDNNGSVSDVDDNGETERSKVGETTDGFQITSVASPQQQQQQQMEPSCATALMVTPVRDMNIVKELLRTVVRWVADDSAVRLQESEFDSGQ